MASIKQQYQRNRRRIQRYVNKYSKKGIIFPDNIIPPIPKKITKASVRRLERITPKVLREKGKSIDVETGEIRSFIFGLRQAKKLDKEEEYTNTTDSSMLDDIIIAEFFNRNRYFGDRINRLLHEWVDLLINMSGKRYVSTMIENASRAGVFLSLESAYDKDKFMAFLAQMQEYHPEAGQYILDQIADEWEEWDM